MAKHSTIDAGEQTIIQANCLHCGTCYTQVVPTESYTAWSVKGEHIQNAMPMVPIDMRELLISDMCGECFDKLFEGEEE